MKNGIGLRTVGSLSKTFELANFEMFQISSLIESVLERFKQTIWAMKLWFKFLRLWIFEMFQAISEKKIGSIKDLVSQTNYSILIIWKLSSYFKTKLAQEKLSFLIKQSELTNFEITNFLPKNLRFAK